MKEYKNPEAVHRLPDFLTISMVYQRRYENEDVSSPKLVITRQTPYCSVTIVATCLLTPILSLSSNIIKEEICFFGIATIWTW